MGCECQTRSIPSEGGQYLFVVVQKWLQQTRAKPPSATTERDHCPVYAASLSFGLSPARAANRTSKSMLNRSILPRFRSDTRA
jgi:hypothetical protein